jgi:hypothetical protein
VAEMKSPNEKLIDLLEAYGAGVKAGVITPCLQDENAFRKLMGLEPAPPAVEADWDKSEGVRKPITLQKLAEIKEDEAQVEAFPESIEEEKLLAQAASSTGSKSKFKKTKKEVINA